MQLPDRCCGSTPPPLSLSPTFFTRAAQTPPLTHPSPATILVTPSCWAPAAATLTWHAPPPCSPPLCLDAPGWLLLKAAGVRDGTVPDRLPSSTVPPHLLTPGPDLTSALEPAMRRSTLTSHPGWESLMGLTACKSLELN